MALSLNTAALSPLKEKEFKLYIICRFIYIMALRMVGTVVAYELFHLTQSSFAIGLVGLSEFVPVFSLALYAGHVIDKSEKRTLLLKGMIAYSFCVVLLVICTFPATQNKLSAHGLEYCFYAIIFLTGVIRAFAGPVSNAIVSQLVPRNILQYAANISSSTWLIGSITGHASAGFLIAGIGVNKTFIVILIYVVTAATILSFIKRKPILYAPKDIAAWDSVKQGLRFVFNNKIMMGAISLDLFAVLFGGAVALIPEFSATILHISPIGFGWLTAATDIGSMSIIILLTFFPMRKKQGKRMLLAVAGFGICIIAFGLSNIYFISFMALLCSGVCDGISVMVRGTILQLTTPDEMRGRVSSVNSMFINSSNELGQFESGFARQLLGPVPSVVFGGCMTLLVVVVTWFKAPALKNMEY
ncbi:MFS transporter [Ferruginibacter sp. SUN106]|uniref:MFS transporter n=1 Tax=Ferruginibacter sp. SUN106 TaxID=2978348 RepID=UPI003D36C171